MIEGNIIVIAASLPTIGPVIRYTHGKLTRIYTSGDNSSKGVLREATNWTIGGGNRSRRRGGAIALDSQQDDIHLVHMGHSPATVEQHPGIDQAIDVDHRAIGLKRNEIAKTVDIEAKRERATSADRVKARSQNFNLPLS